MYSLLLIAIPSLLFVSRYFVPCGRCQPAGRACSCLLACASGRSWIHSVPLQFRTVTQARANAGSEIIIGSLAHLHQGGLGKFKVSWQTSNSKLHEEIPERISSIVFARSHEVALRSPTEKCQSEKDSQIFTRKTQARSIVSEGKNRRMSEHRKSTSCGDFVRRFLTGNRLLGEGLRRPDTFSIIAHEYLAR